jgi:curved DNA-binding protein CbpA
VKTHYELLGLEITADADAIKKAFRREIARYHPDKVIHLGTEFQEMAATRAAELTVAYKTLSDAALRAEYDASLSAGLPPHVAAEPPTLDDIGSPPSGGGKARFASERADRDVILRRAIGGRVMTAVEALYGKLETPTVRGFDMALVPTAKPRFMGTPPPRVLVKVVETADAGAVTEAFAAASKARLHAGKSPVVVLLFARQIAPQNELTKANDANARHRKADGPDELAVLVVNTGDWSCRLPPGCSTAVRKLAAKICS